MKLGQQVKGFKFSQKEFDKYNPYGLVGVIISLNGKYNPIIVEWENGIRNSYSEGNLMLM